MLKVEVFDPNRTVVNPETGESLRTPCRMLISDEYRKVIEVEFTSKSIKRYTIETTDEIRKESYKSQSKHYLGGTSIDLSVTFSNQK
jgi:hypothetical protein